MLEFVFNIVSSKFFFKEFHIEKLQPSMNDLVLYMLKQTQDEDEKVALEACEFWMALAEQQDCKYRGFPISSIKNFMNRNLY